MSKIHHGANERFLSNSVNRDLKLIVSNRANSDLKVRGNILIILVHLNTLEPY